MEPAPVLLIGTLDTKGEEIRYLKELLEGSGTATEVVDAGILGEPRFTPDVAVSEILECAAESLAELRKAADRGRATAAVERGIAAWIRNRLREGPIAGVLAIGGSAGTSIATAAMRELPVGVPKLMVSTMASGNTRPYVGITDTSMMYSVADFAGLNRLTRVILGNAARAMAGMTRFAREAPNDEPNRPLLGATMFGVTTPCVSRVRQLLEDSGYELLIFHATGTGGQAMERLVRDDFIEGVLDITTTEWADELVGGALSAGPHRLEAAGEKGAPQVISTGALDMVNFGPPDSVPDKFRGRLFYRHNPNVTLMRTTREENRQLGRILAEKANQARGPVTIVLPLRGVSALDAVGREFHDPGADAALFDAIRGAARPPVKLLELDLHINDPAFAECLVSEYLSVARGRSSAIHS